MGLLWLWPQSLYDLNQAFKASLAQFYSASLGSLQTALRNLEAKGLVTFDQVHVGRRAKKMYRILEPGREAFLAEFRNPLPQARLEDTALCRVHFLGLVPSPQARLDAVDRMVAEVEAALAGLESLAEQVAKLQVPEDYLPIFRFQTKTLDYGLAAHRTALAWFQNLRRDLEES